MCGSFLEGGHGIEYDSFLEGGHGYVYISFHAEDLVIFKQLAWPPHLLDIPLVIQRQHVPSPPHQLTFRPQTKQYAPTLLLNT